MSILAQGFAGMKTRGFKYPGCGVQGPSHT
nr:MAG TPA: hypothetical protein [Caudoviricetes sp.]DAH46979.1 MAG TPA: hypothetical protein [Caudoviricetes sp.]